MRPNLVKQALAAGEVQLGTGFGQIRSVDVIRILAAAGFKWAFIDSEHGGFDLETVQDICRVAVPAGLAPIVRVADLQYSLVARSLDVGVLNHAAALSSSTESLTSATSDSRTGTPLRWATMSGL